MWNSILSLRVLEEDSLFVVKDWDWLCCVMKRSIKVLCYYDATLPISDPELGQQDLAQCHFDLRNEKKTPAAVDSPDPHSISRKDFALIQAHTCTHTSMRYSLSWDEYMAWYIIGSVWKFRICFLLLLNMKGTSLVFFPIVFLFIKQRTVEHTVCVTINPLTQLKPMGSSVVHTHIISNDLGGWQNKLYWSLKPHVPALIF